MAKPTGICLALLVATLPFSVQALLAQSTSGTLSSHQQPARDIFREVVEINTTAKIGSTKAAEAMAARLKTAGFRESDMALVGPTLQNRNLVVRYRGKGIHRPILLIAHLDVVEALRSDWSSAPFTFLEKDGFFYGRGTSDMKNEVAEIVANFARLKREGFVPNRDLVLALTEDEEGGDANGIQWLLANRRDLIDVEFAINLEGGGGDIQNGKPILMEAQSKGGHSSLPVKDNAIYRLAAGLTRLS